MAESGANGRVMVIDDRRSSVERIAQALREIHDVELETDAKEALARSSNGNYDLFIVSLSLTAYDGLRLCSQIRSFEATRQIPVLAVAGAGGSRENPSLSRARRERLSFAADRPQ